MSVESCSWWHRFVFLFVIGSTVGAGIGDIQNTMKPIHLVDLRRTSIQDLASRVLQLTRTSVHLLVQQLYPRTHAQLRESFRCLNSRCFCRAAHESCNHARSQSFRAKRSTTCSAPIRSQHNVHHAHLLHCWLHRQCAIPPNTSQETIACL